MDKRQKNILFYCTLFLVILTIICSFVCHSMANINLEMRNNNIVDSVGTDFSFSATGNVSLSGSVGAIYDLSFYKGEYGANINASNSVMYSRMGDITVDCNTVAEALNVFGRDELVRYEI